LPKNVQAKSMMAGPEHTSKPDQTRGPKGNRTRRRVMDATAALLTEHALADIRITDIARAAEIAQPNFYTYFDSIEDVILAIATEISADSLSIYLQPDWSGEDGLVHARQFVEAAFQFWLKYREIFAIVNVLADKKHGAFADVRVSQMRTIYKSFEAKVRKAQTARRISRSIAPRLAGYECVSIIGSVSQRYELLRASGFTHVQLVETTARLLHMIATGG
jgi:AcrR family transcriptional regulator